MGRWWDWLVEGIFCEPPRRSKKPAGSIVGIQFNKSNPIQKCIGVFVYLGNSYGPKN